MRARICFGLGDVYRSEYLARACDESLPPHTRRMNWNLDDLEFWTDSVQHHGLPLQSLDMPLRFSVAELLTKREKAACANVAAGIR